MTNRMILERGGNVSIGQAASRPSRVCVSLGWSPSQASGMEIDASAFLLKADGKVRGDSDIVFYNNARSEEGAVEVETPARGDAQAFRLDLGAIPSTVERIAFCVTIHEGQARDQSFGRLQSAWASLIDVSGATEIARFELPLAGATESAMIFCEVYRRMDEWKFRAVGQGFEGGLGPLATHFGLSVEDDGAAGAATASRLSEQSQRRISLEKRLIDLEKKDPQLVSLVKKVGVSLAKKGLEDHQAKVALCLDISASMSGLYRSGAIDTLVRRVLALGLRFDDDGRIDVFLFGEHAHDFGSVGADNYTTFVPDMQRRYRLEGGTCYGKVMQMIRGHYRADSSFGRVPVYVMFVTDGDTQDRPIAEEQIREASREGLFWQFMAIGPRKDKAKGFFSRLLASDFTFLAHLDNLQGRHIDNANFFQVENPAEPSDEEMYELLMGEYPHWLKAARDKGVLAG